MYVCLYLLMSDEFLTFNYYITQQVESIFAEWFYSIKYDTHFTNNK